MTRLTLEDEKRIRGYQFPSSDADKLLGEIDWLRQSLVESQQSLLKTRQSLLESLGERASLLEKQSITGPLFVYVAGPLTKGSRPTNIHQAVQAGMRIRMRGHIPFVPHLFELWDLIAPQDYEYWLAMDLQWIARCDVLVRLDGESAGSDREVAEAQRLEKPVFFGLTAFMESPLWVPE